MSVSMLRRADEGGDKPPPTTRRRWRQFFRRRSVIAVILVFTLVFGYFAVTFVQVWMAARRDGARPAEAIVVLGAAQYNGRPSPVLRARLDHAADLYEQGFAPVVVVTGGRAAGDRYSEATASANYLHTRGVPDEAILREVEGRNSWQSLAASARFMKRRGITDVILVSDPFHAARIQAMANELGLHATTSPTRTSPIGGVKEFRRMVGETFKVGIGRIIGFRRLVKASDASRAAQGASSALRRAILTPGR
jgi:uncharacterized SAM-binding protein YcdF (DUF218 family)